MKQENDIRLKRGWTTGACATAATKAGLYALWTDEKLDVVSITLPKGEQPLFRISFFEQKIDGVEVGIIKDAGDDPDVTHGSLIKVKVQETDNGIEFCAGPGVGIVTKPGLPIPVGDPAINPMPRKFISEIINLFQSGSTEEALIKSENLIKKEKEVPFLLNLNGIININLNNWDKAKISLKKAINLDQNYVEAYNNLGIVHTNLGEIEEAIKNKWPIINLK